MRLDAEHDREWFGERRETLKPRPVRGELLNRVLEWPALVWSVQLIRRMPHIGPEARANFYKSVSAP